MTQIGDIFPIEKLTTPKGSVSLDGSAYTVLYFYPKDDTPGCTIEANQFQKLKPTYDKQNIRILGVSVDDADSHADFCEKFSLAFELVTDKDAALGTELGILRPSGPRGPRRQSRGPPGLRGDKRSAAVRSWGKGTYAARLAREAAATRRPRARLDSRALTPRSFQVSGRLRRIWTRPRSGDVAQSPRPVARSAAGSRGPRP